MNITYTPLYSRLKKAKKHARSLRITAAIIATIIPMHTLGFDAVHNRPYYQDFVITAYYSPLPGQCCYIKGGLEADKILNGEGIQSTDGTPVYPGMVAAPPSYAFGTRIRLPGLGIVEVNDRGGAIQVLDTGAHRLDVWAGHGEEGLARALAFGVMRVKGRVFPNGGRQPLVEIDLEKLPAPDSFIAPYALEPENMVPFQTKLGERGYSVRLVQDALRELGYFNRTSSGLFGEETRNALAAFNADHGIHEGAADILSQQTAAVLSAALQRKDTTIPLNGYVDFGASKTTVAKAQRTLRFLGYYKGRTNGLYDENTRSAILTFQQQHKLVGQNGGPGAGRIGPLTLEVLQREWNKSHAIEKSETLIDLHEVDEILKQKNLYAGKFVGEGEGGKGVRIIQTLLSRRGFFPENEINGWFGPLTKQAVLNYQLARGIVTDPSDEYAGYVGMGTLKQLRKEERKAQYSIVRSHGWEAL